MTRISEMPAPVAAITGMERLPALQGDTNANLPAFALGEAPRGAVLILERPFLADTAATADADPGAGNLRWNHATQASATVLYVNDADTAAASIAAAIASLQVGGFVYVQGKDVAGAGTWQKWQVTSNSDAVGYTKLGVTLVASAGSFADNAELWVSLQQPEAAGGSSAAADISIADAGGYFAGTNVEAALQELGAAGGGGGGSAPVSTISGTTYTVAAADDGKYLRFTNTSAKTVTIDPDATTPLPADGEWTIRNHGTSNLTISPGGGVTVNLPSGGSLVIGTGGACVLKRVATDTFDLL